MLFFSPVLVHFITKALVVSFGFKEVIANILINFLRACNLEIPVDKLDLIILSMVWFLVRANEIHGKHIFYIEHILFNLQQGAYTKILRNKDNVFFLMHNHG